MFVVNKADRDGAGRAAAEIEGMLSLRARGADEWCPPVVRTCAAAGDGVDELLAAVRRFAGRGAAAADRARRRARARLESILAARLLERIAAARGLDDAVAAVVSREVDPYTAASGLLRRFAQEAGDS